MLDVSEKPWISVYLTMDIWHCVFLKGLYTQPQRKNGNIGIMKRNQNFKWLISLWYFYSLNIFFLTTNNNFYNEYKSKTIILPYSLLWNVLNWDITHKLCYVGYLVLHLPNETLLFLILFVVVFCKQTFYKSILQDRLLV